MIYPRLFPLVIVLLLVGGCASFTDLPAGTVREVSTSALMEVQNIESPSMPGCPVPSPEYRIGAGDSLYVNVQGKPELGSPVTVGNTGGVKGSRVDGDGNLHLPLAGSVQVKGLTVAEAQAKIAEAYAHYLNHPWVVVEVAEYHSQPIYLLGQFRNAGTFYLDRPYTLLQGISLGGGLLDTANLRSARLIRNNQTQPVDLYAVLQQGDCRMNVWLQPGDTIFVPDDRNQNVFVFGEVKKPGPVPMPNGQLFLEQALASAGLNEIRANVGYVRIIRSLSATKGQLLVVDLGKVLHGKALPFPLMEGDIVYVPRSGVGNWNEALGEILPSLQAVSAVLQPFVQINYLKNNN